MNIAINWRSHPIFRPQFLGLTSSIRCSEDLPREDWPLVDLSPQNLQVFSGSTSLPTPICQGLWKFTGGYYGQCKIYIYIMCCVCLMNDGDILGIFHGYGEIWPTKKKKKIYIVYYHILSDIHYSCYYCSCSRYYVENSRFAHVFSSLTHGLPMGYVSQSKAPGPKIFEPSVSRVREGINNCWQEEW